MALNAEKRGMFDTGCGSLFRELQLIWDEMGESDEERDKIVLQLEQECLEVYRRKVEYACATRAQLQQYLADLEAEVGKCYACFGEKPTLIKGHVGTLRQRLSCKAHEVEELRQKMKERARQLQELNLQIHMVRCEISGISPEDIPVCSPVSEDDLSTRRLENFDSELQAVQKEKNDRFQMVLEYVDTVHQLCSVLAVDFVEVISKVHPSLAPIRARNHKSISSETLGKLVKMIESLEEEKRQRMHKLQDLATSLIELWSLMDTSSEEQLSFQHVTCQLAASEHEVTAPDILGINIIKAAEVEVERLIQLKAIRIKELVLKKRAELEDIWRRAHMESDTNSSSQDAVLALVESGIVDPSELLASVEEQIGKAKEEAFSRKEIMEKVEKWLTACEQESWLEEYNKDENRYNASRTAHVNLKRAEKARVTVSKIPALVESLATKARAWEEERSKQFSYDGVRLLAMLEEYNLLREEKEEQKRQLRDKKRLQEVLINEQETLFGSRPSPNKSNAKKGQGSFRTGTVAICPLVNRRLSLGPMLEQAATPESITKSRHGARSTKESRSDQLQSVGGARVNFVSKDDTMAALLSGVGTGALDIVTSALPEKDVGCQSPRTPLSPVPISAVKSNILQVEDTINVNQQLKGTPFMRSLKDASSVVEEHYQCKVKHKYEYSFEERRAELHCYQSTNAGVGQLVS